MRSARTRARLALTLCVLWLAGFEVLPWMHIALHEHLAPHHHDASGATIFDDHDAEVDEHAAHHDDDDDLDAEVDEHGAPVHHHDRHAHADAEARLAAALEHGQHSLAHHGIAVPTPPPVLTQPLPVDRRATYLVATATAEPPSFSPGRAVARGPPVPLHG
jgi:hypothetical protein